MKIKLPNPDEFVNNVIGFFDQLELCVYHARKSAEKILANYSREDITQGDDTPFVKFRIAAFDSGNQIAQSLEEIDCDRTIENDIEIEIVEL